MKEPRKKEPRKYYNVECNGHYFKTLGCDPQGFLCHGLIATSPVRWLKVERLTHRELLPYNHSFGSYPNILLAQSRAHKGNRMANHFSALKRARQTTKRTTRNRANTSALRTALRDLRESLAKGDKAASEQVYRQTVSSLDRAVQKGVLHKNTASRYKSRLSARLSALK